MNNKVRTLVKKLTEDFDFENVKDTKSKNITKVTKKAIEDYKSSLIKLSDYRNNFSSYREELKDLYLTLGHTFKGLGWDTTTGNIDIQKISEELSEYWQGKTKFPPKTVNAIFLYFLYSDQFGLGFDYFIDEDIKDDDYVIKSMSDDNVSGIYELVFRSLEWAEYN